MNFCKIGDYGLEQFLQPVLFTTHSLACTTTESKSSNEISLYLRVNHLTHKSVEKLKHVLTLQSNPITCLDLSRNFNHSTTNKYVALKHLIECLSHKKCSLRTLVVGLSGFTEQHMYHLVLLLVHSHSLQHLYLNRNSLSTGFALFCSGLKMNKCLTFLRLMYVTLSDDDILLLADALHQHSKLSDTRYLRVQFISIAHLFAVLAERYFVLLQGAACLRFDVDNRQYYPAMEQLENYQASRLQNGLPQIYLEGLQYGLKIIIPSSTWLRKSATENVEKSLLTGQ